LRWIFPTGLRGSGSVRKMTFDGALRYLAAEFDTVEVQDSDLHYHPTIVSRSLQQLRVRFHDR